LRSTNSKAEKPRSWRWMHRSYRISLREIHLSARMCEKMKVKMKPEAEDEGLSGQIDVQIGLSDSMV
jgi:hypothetical protein